MGYDRLATFSWNETTNYLQKLNSWNDTDIYFNYLVYPPTIVTIKFLLRSYYFIAFAEISLEFAGGREENGLPSQWLSTMA